MSIVIVFEFSVIKPLDISSIFQLFICPLISLFNFQYIFSVIRYFISLNLSFNLYIDPL